MCYTFQIPSFPSVILRSENLDLSESPSLTDAGLCTTLNGNSMINTFHDSNNRMKQFIKILGLPTNNTFKSVKISGSGNKHMKKLWLNVRDTTGYVRGMMQVAVNEWKDYISARYGCTGFNNFVFFLY
jgi:hypothetical protein